VHSIAERVNGGYLRAMSQTLSGAARVIGQADPDGIEALRASVEWLDVHQILLSMSWNEAWLAESLLVLGRHDEAEHHAERALARAREWDALGEAAALRVLAGVYRERDRDPDRAKNALEKARECALNKGSRRELLLTELAACAPGASEGPSGVPIATQALRERLHSELAELGVRPIDRAS
jgi:tetratricopeptide (TPR) repeat protein